MLALFPPTFVVNTKIIYGYNFVDPLIVTVSSNINSASTYVYLLFKSTLMQI